MKIDSQEVNGYAAGREVWILADGLSCPLIPEQRDALILAVNHGWQNYAGRPFGILFQDMWFGRYLCPDVATRADNIFCSETAGRRLPASLRYRALGPDERITASFADGLYCAGNSGIQALSLALIMRAKKIRLFGFDYRLFSEVEARHYFQRGSSVHRSSGPHRDANFNSEKFVKLFSENAEKFIKFRAYREMIVDHSVYGAISFFPKEQSEYHYL